ncbi:MAG: agmatinase [Defluviitaleaceae bacterium]|nr:agmatinase [Defluviitaleaceae bacterium]
MLNKHGNIQNFLGCDSDYANAQIVLFGAPYDATTSNRPGARFAPAAMRGESYALETYSPYIDKDLEADVAVYDAGDLELYGRSPTVVLDMIEQATAEILSDNKTPIMIGGEHLVTLGAIRAAYKKYPDLHIIHFDAHTDLRQDYLGEELSHATVIRRCHDLIGDNKIFQVGVRSGTKEEFEWRKTHLAQTLEHFIGKPVYFTLDLDVLDPSTMSGTGTPEAGGMTFNDLLNDILHLQKFNVIGCDIVELAPNYDTSGVSTATACKILRELILTIGGTQNG